MTIEQELLDLQQAQEELNNIDYMFPYAPPEYRERARKVAQEKVDILQLRVNRKKNIAETKRLQDEAMYEEARAKKLEKRADNFLSPLSSFEAITDASANTVGAGVDLASNLAIGLPSYLTRAVGQKTGIGLVEKLGEFGMGLNRRIKDTKRDVALDLASGDLSGAWNSFAGNNPTPVPPEDFSYFEGVGGNNWDSPRNVAQNIIGPVGRFTEGYYEFAPMSVLLGGVSSGVGKAGKYLNASDKAIRNANIAANIGVFAGSSAPDISDYIEQQSGEFRPLTAAASSGASALAMEVAFAIGRGKGMNDAEAYNYANRMLTENGLAMLSKKAIKQGLTTAIANGVLHGAVGSAIRETASFKDPLNPTDKELDRFVDRVWEGFKQETVQGGFLGTLGALNYHRDIAKTFKELGGKSKKTIKVKENGKMVDKEVSAFKHNASAQLVLKAADKVRESDKTAFDNLFKTGTSEDVKKYLDAVNNSIPEKLAFKNSAEMSAAKDTYDFSVWYKWGNTKIGQMEQLQKGKISGIRKANRLDAQMILSPMKQRLEDLKARFQYLSHLSDELDEKIEAKDTPLPEQQELAKQKEEVLVKKAEVRREVETPYTRAEVIEAVRDMVNRKKANSPEQMNRVNELLARFLVKDRGNKPISVDDAIALLNEVEAELNNVGYSDYNADIEDIVSPKLIDMDTEQPTSVLSDGTQFGGLLPNETQPQGLLPQRETPLLEYRPMQNPPRSVMDISQGSNQPLNTLNIGEKITKETPSGFGVSNKVLSKKESFAGETTKSQPKPVRAEASKEQPEAWKKQNAESTVPQSVSQSSNEPVAVKKESTEKSSAVQKTPVESKDIEAKYAKFVDLVNEFKKSKNEKLSKQEVIKLAKEAGLTKAEFIDLVNKSKEIKYNKPYAESMEDWENWKPSEKVRQFILNYGNTKEKPVTKKYSAELKTYNLDDSIDFDGNKTVKELVKDLSDSNSLVISGKSDGDNTTYEISKKKGKRKISVSKDVYDYAKGLEDKKAESTDDGFNGFLKGKQPFEKGAAKKALNKVTKYDGKTVKEVIDQLAEEGTLMTEVDTSKKGVKTFHVGASDPEGRWRFGEYFKGKTVYEYAEYMKSKMGKKNTVKETEQKFVPDYKSKKKSSWTKEDWEDYDKDQIKIAYDILGEENTDTTPIEKTNDIKLSKQQQNMYKSLKEFLPDIFEVYDREAESPAPVQALMNILRGGESLADIETAITRGDSREAIDIIKNIKQRVELTYSKDFSNRIAKNCDRLIKMIKNSNYRSNAIKPISLEELEAQPINRMPQEDVESWREGRELYVADKRETEPSKQSKREYADIARNVAELYREGKITKEQRKYFYDNLKPEYDFNLDVNLKKLEDYQKEIVSREREKLRSSEAFLVQSLNKGLISFNDFVERRRKLSIDYHDSLWKSGILTNGIRRQIVDPNRYKPQLSRTKDKATNPVTDKELNNFLRGQAKQISKETGLSFKVVNSVDELRKMFPNNDITDTVEGGIHKDTVYLVRGNIDRDRLPLVIAHEVAGHRGVESLFENKQQMDNFFNSLERAAVKDKFIRDAFAEVDRLGYKENRSREAMAKIVEKVKNESGTLKGTAKTFVNFITSRVRRLLRRMGFKNLQLNEAEVYDIAVQALRRTGLKNSNKFFGLDRFLAKDNSSMFSFKQNVQLRPEDRLSAATIFSGGGLVEAGLDGIVTNKGALENDANTARVYTDNHGKHMIVGSVLNDADVERLYKEVGDKVDYFHASPVCHNFSRTKNNRSETKQDIQFANATAKAINRLQPKIFTCENASDYKNSKSFQIITKALEENGYKWDDNVYRHDELGGATKRERVIIRAVKEGELPSVKMQTTPQEKSWYEAVKDLIPDAPVREKPFTERQSGLFDTTKIDGMNIYEYAKKTGKPVWISGNGHGEWRAASAEDSAPTITANGASEDWIIMPDGTAKEVTPKMLARLMGLPENYKLPKSKTLAHQILGNGVPTEMTREVIAPLLLNRTPKESPSIKDDSLKSLGLSERNGKASWTDERINYLIDEYGSKSDNRYSQAYATTIDPVDFLKLTLGEKNYQKLWKQFPEDFEVKDLNPEKLKGERQTPFLIVEGNAKDPTRIIGHEGRHRLLALAKAGIKNVPVVVIDKDTKYNKEVMPPTELKNQKGQNNSIPSFKAFTQEQMIPIKESNRETLRKMFGGESDIQFSIGERKVKPAEDVAKKTKEDIYKDGYPYKRNFSKAVKPYLKKNLAEYEARQKGMFQNQKNSGYKMSAMEASYLTGFDVSHQQILDRFKRMNDSAKLRNYVREYINANVTDGDKRAKMLDMLAKQKTNEGMYDVALKTHIEAERIIRNGQLNTLKQTLKDLKANKISREHSMLKLDALSNALTQEELDGLLDTNDFSTGAVRKMYSLLRTAKASLNTIRDKDNGGKLDVPVRIDELVAELDSKFNKSLIPEEGKEVPPSMKVSVEDLAKLNVVLSDIKEQSREAIKNLAQDSRNEVYNIQQQSLKEMDPIDEKIANSREDKRVGAFNTYVKPVTAVENLDLDNFSARMGDTMNKTVHKAILDGQKTVDHYLAKGYKEVDDIVSSFGKDKFDGEENLGKTFMSVDTTNKHKYDITKDEAMAIYALSTDRETRKLINAHGGLTLSLGDKKGSDTFILDKQKLKDIESKLTDKEKEAVARGKKLLAQTFLPALNDVYERLNGVPLRLIVDGTYFPRTYQQSSSEGSIKGVFDNLSQPYIVDSSTGGYASFLKSRGDNVNLRLRGFSKVIESYVNQASNYIGMAEPLKRLNRVLDNSMRKEITQRYGVEYVNRLDRAMKLISGMGGKTREDQQAMSRYLSNLAAAKLTPVSALKQFSSVPLASSVIPYEYLAKASIGGGLSKENIAEMMELDAMQLRYRDNGMGGIMPLNATTREAEHNLGTFKNTKWNKVVKWGLNLSLMADKRALGIIYKATKLMAEAKGKGSDKAWIENKFMEAVRRTQNTTDLASAPGWQELARNSSAWAFINMYLNQTQKIPNEFLRLKRFMNQAEKKHGKDSAQYKEAKGNMVNFVIGMGLMNAMTIGAGALAGSVLHKKDDKKTAKETGMELTTNTLLNFTGNPVLKTALGGSGYALQKAFPKAFGGKGQKATAESFGNDITSVVPDMAYTFGRIFEDLNSNDPAARKLKKITTDALSSRAFESSLAMARIPTWYLRYPAMLLRNRLGDSDKGGKKPSSSSAPSSSSGSSRLFSGKRTFGNSRTFGGKRMF